jgi:hypothetical protein
MPDIRINALATTAAAPVADDFLELDGATNGGRKLRAHTLHEWDSTRTASGYLYSDGATSNRAQIQTPGTRGALASSAAASWVGWVDVPTASSTAEVASLSSSITALASATAWSLGIAFSTADLIIRANGATAATDYRTLTVSAFRTTYSGQRIWLDVRITNGTSAPTVFVNGAAVSGTAGTGSGTSPDWLSASLVSTYHVTGYGWPAASAPQGQWINTTLTNAESDAWRITGRPPAWVAFGGDCLKPTTASWANNNNASYDFDTFTGSATGFSATQDNTGRPYAFAFFNAAQTPLPFGRYRCTFTLASTGRALPKLSAASSGAAAQTLSVGANAIILDPVGGIINPVFVGDPYLTSEGANAFNFTVSNFECVRVGALSLPSIQSIPVVRDLTAIGGNQARLVGMTPIIGAEVSPISLIDVPATAFLANTWTQILGGTLSGARRQRIVSIAGNSSANTTLDVGINGSTATLVSAQTTNGDFDLATFASRIVPAGSSLWLRFAGATTANVTIQLSPA